jgi:hypothetical protein
MRRSHERPPLQPFGPSCSTRKRPRVRNLLPDASLRSPSPSPRFGRVPVLGEVLAGVVEVGVAALEPAACLGAVLPFPHLILLDRVCRLLAVGARPCAPA